MAGQAGSSRPSRSGKSLSSTAIQRAEEELVWNSDRVFRTPQSKTGADPYSNKGQYVVKKIVSQGKRCGMLTYKVMWEGLPEEAATSETEVNVRRQANWSTLLEDFHNEQEKVEEVSKCSPPLRSALTPELVAL